MAFVDFVFAVDYPLPQTRLINTLLVVIATGRPLRHDARNRIRPTR